MSQKPADVYLPDSDQSPTEPAAASPQVRKFAARLTPGKARYDLKHNFGTEDVLVQTRIAGNVREGGITVLDENTVRIGFGGPLHEPMDVVILG
jgi:hypothetical protein